MASNMQGTKFFSSNQNQNCIYLIANQIIFLLGFIISFSNALNQTKWRNITFKAGGHISEVEIVGNYVVTENSNSLLYSYKNNLTQNNISEIIEIMMDEVMLNRNIIGDKMKISAIRTARFNSSEVLISGSSNKVFLVDFTPKKEGTILKTFSVSSSSYYPSIETIGT